MNEKVKKFLDTKKEDEKKVFEKKKNETLIELGLFEKIYSDKDDYSKDFPYSEYDSNLSKNRWYKKQAISISDEEYEEVKKYSDFKDTNPIASTLKAIAIIIYVFGFFASFALGTNGYGNTAIMVVFWIFVFFILGTTYLGFAEIIQLLDNIKKK